MPAFVSFNDVGLNFLERGEMRVLTAGGYRYHLPAGRLSAYWGAVPHKVEWFAPRTFLHWITLPLGTFLGWSMPASFTRQLIEGRVFFETDPDESPIDQSLFRRWNRVIPTRHAEGTVIVLLELQARLRRLALSASGQRRIARIVPRGPSSQAERMLLLIAEHFREELSAGDVARSVGLHPGYASGLFQRHVGMGLMEYITQCRLSHAKALLATTDTKLLDLATASGFGSVSQFHAVFKRLVGCTPRAYRQDSRPTPPSS
jgi:AraC-like DNA-binding protein